MKKSQLIIAAVLTLASVSARAQLASYQSTVNGQSPSYYFTFDNSSLSDSLGSGATFATGGTAPLPTAGPITGATRTTRSRSRRTLPTCLSPTPHPLSAGRAPPTESVR